MTPEPTGPLVMPHQVAEAAIATVKDWMKFELAKVERLEGLTPGEIQPPVNYLTGMTTPMDNWPQKKLPAVKAVSTGWAQNPVWGSSGELGMVFNLAIGGVVKGPKDAPMRKLASMYAAAIMEAVVQHGTLGGFAEWTRPTDLDSSATLTESSTVGYITTEYEVKVSDGMNAYAGLDTPPGNPYEPPPGPIDVTDVEVAVDPKF